MTNLYEYKHQIINKYLASGADDGSGRKFQTLDDWYNVVHDYEFQARCPIILKNSHRNKHFTFACHLKTCKFKILVSYCGNHRDSFDLHNHDHLNNHHNHLTDNETDIKTKDEVDDIQKIITEVNNHKENKETKYEDSNAADDDDVSAAIAAAVAAVNDKSSNDDNDDDINDVSKLQMNNGLKNDAHIESMDGNMPSSSLKGPFMVTKIDPYHNHPLESNLSLGKFVLTKIPRILQHDLNFDTVLLDLCNDQDNTVQKFRVSQYVDESGIQDILKQRYSLTENDLDKKLISQISRRVTTYKARFVLKKKKIGQYGIPSGGSNNNSGTSSDINENNIVITSNGENLNDNLSSGSNTNVLASRPSQQRYSRPTAMNNNDSNLSSLETNQNLQSALSGVQVQAAAQAAMGESSYDDNNNRNKRPMEEETIGEDDEEEQRKRQAIKLNAMNALVNDENQLVNLEDNGDDKLPHEVAEQLRLLSSHFKDVESQQNNEDSNSLNKIIKDDVPDENIQPELRGQ